jgi:hypothetical protein
MKRGWLVAGLMALMLGAGLQARAQTMPMGEHESMPMKPAVASTTLTVAFDGKATTLSVADLQAMPQTTLTAKNGHNGKDETYTGVAVGDLLAKLGFTFDNKTAKRRYRSYVKAEGTDGYWVLYSASELTPILRETASLVALRVDGKPLGDEGAFKIVIAGEKRPARWVRNLKALSVVTLE